MPNSSVDAEERKCLRGIDVRTDQVCARNNPCKVHNCGPDSCGCTGPYGEEVEYDG